MATTQAERNQELERDTVSYLRRAYPLAAELSLMPKSAGQTPTFNAFSNWVGEVFNELATREDEVDAAPNQGVWDLIVIDFAALDALNPNLVLRDFVRL